VDTVFRIALPDPLTGLVAAGAAVAGVAFALIGRPPAAATERAAHLAA
jgi:hypothetical protein